MIEWKKEGVIYRGHEEGEPDLAVHKVGPRWQIYTNVSVGPNGKLRGKYLTWRPTLRDAKQRSNWAYFVDLGGQDEQYKRADAA